jgi:hypothetical protein
MSPPPSFRVVIADQSEIYLSSIEVIHSQIRYDGKFEIVIGEKDLPRIEHWQDPAQPDESEVQKLGFNEAKEAEQQRWIEHALNLARRDLPATVKRAYLEHVRSMTRTTEIEREILLLDISVSFHRKMIGI